MYTSYSNNHEKLCSVKNKNFDNACVLHVYTFCADWVNKGLLLMLMCTSGEGGGDEGH